ncbi:MAG: hypothetical protein FWD91_07540, partial [Treponema sp.]|nr:hypothetical protein [Treponema sp.]
MKASVFRSVDEWKSALMTLPDNRFFELLRSVFGNIKTPFSKQRLMDDLFNLLSREEIRATIAAYINGQDHKVIAAVALLHEPLPAELERFFTGELSGSELHALVLNLEERLILYRLRIEGVLHLSLNPVLEKILAPFAADPSPLFPSFLSKGKASKSSAKKGKETPPLVEIVPPPSRLFDGRVFAAFLSFLYDHSGEETLKGETETASDSASPFAGTQSPAAKFRGLRKKVLDDAKKIFPDIDVEMTVRTLLQLELFRAEGCSVIPCGEKIAGYSGLSQLERKMYWAAALYLCQTETAHSDIGSLYWGRLRKTAAAIHRFITSIDSEKKYPEVTLRRMLELQGRDDGGSGNVWGTRLFDDRLHLSFSPLLAAAEKAGLLQRAEPAAHAESVKTGTCWKTAAVEKPVAAAPEKSIAKKSVAEKDAAGSDVAAPVIVMNTAFSFILYPEIAFADAQ